MSEKLGTSKTSNILSLYNGKSASALHVMKRLIKSKGVGALFTGISCLKYVLIKKICKKALCY